MEVIIFEWWCETSYIFVILEFIIDRLMTKSKSSSLESDNIGLKSRLFNTLDSEILLDNTCDNTSFDDLMFCTITEVFAFLIYWNHCWRFLLGDVEDFWLLYLYNFHVVLSFSIFCLCLPHVVHKTSWTHYRDNWPICVSN